LAVSVTFKLLDTFIKLAVAKLPKLAFSAIILPGDVNEPSCANVQVLAIVPPVPTCTVTLPPRFWNMSV
jgi:hypothetical protein